jgi:hypothetical protein
MDPNLDSDPDPEHCFIVPAPQFTGPAFLIGNMKGSELLIDPDTGEMHALPMAEAEARAEEGEEEQRLEASCVRLRLFCPNKFPGMSVGNVYLGFPALPYFLNVNLCFE